MATWTITSATANGEGSQIILGVTVTGTDTEIPTSTAGKWEGFGTKVSAIQRWRFDSTDGAVTAKGGSAGTADGGVLAVDVYDMSEPSGSATRTIAFKVIISLKASARIAIHPDGGAAAKILRLQTEWAKLTWSMPGYQPLLAPQIDDVAYNADAVGRLPAPSGSTFKLHADAIAEYTGRDGPTTPLDLDTWENLAGGTDLVGGPSTDEPDLNKASGKPFVEFDPTSRIPRFALASPPSITTNFSVAALVDPHAAAAEHMVVGRYSYAGRSWRVAYDDGDEPAIFRYDTVAGASVASMTLHIPDGVESPFLVLLRRESDTVEAWMNGPPVVITDEPAGTVDAGSGDLTIGGRETASATWGEGFDGEINEVALYSESVNDLEASLILHQMAMRGLVSLGTPIPSAMQTQPYANHADPERRLTGRPIAVINLYKDGDENPWGQSPNWRNASQSSIESFLRNKIREAFVGCDQFEIMFNRPGGNPRGDIVPTYVFGGESGLSMITPTMWLAMRAVWDDCGYNGWGLSHYNDDAVGIKRGWFYTGGGLPLNDDATIRTDGRLGERAVGPITGTTYKDEILDLWTANPLEDVGDIRYRCFFLDAVEPFYGQFVGMVHTDDVNENYTLVGEPVPTDDAGRSGAPWFCFVRYAKAPWWNVFEGEPNINAGYNSNWTSPGDEGIVYFGVISSSDYPDLRIDDAYVGSGDNLTLGDLYRWIRKGGVPVAWAGGYAKVGAAWDYATGRLPVSRYGQSMRAIRGLRV